MQILVWKRQMQMELQCDQYRNFFCGRFVWTVPYS